MQKKMLLALSLIPLFGIGFIHINHTAESKAESQFNGARRFINDYSYAASDEPQYTKQNLYQFNTMNAASYFATNRGENVTVAVIDTGANIYHEDFLKPEAQGKTITASNVEQYSILSPKSCHIYDNSSDADDLGYYTNNVVTEVGILKCLDTDTYDSEYEDYYSHGTCTGSVIGAATNGVGGLGLASGCTLMIIRSDLYDNSIDVAIRYAADNGADIISMSFGGYAETWTDSEGETYEGYSEMATDLQDAINYAYNKGVTLFASAGNENTGSHLSYPAANKHVIGVGALAKQSKTTRASYSNWNVVKNNVILEDNNCDLTAPGTVWTAGVEDAKNTKNVYIETSGTSFSCPLTAAAAALYKSANPDATPDDIEQALYDSCDDLGDSGIDKTFGHGRVNVASLLTPVGPVESISLNKSSLDLGVGKTKTLEVIYNPTNAYNKGVTWSSSNSSVASVDSSGVITGIEEGMATITATSIDGVHTATCTVNVSTVSSEEYQITFSCSASLLAEATSAKIVSATNCEPENMITSYSPTKIYLDNNRLKMGSRNATGTLVIYLNDTYDISNIVIDSSQYSSDAGSLKLTAGTYSSTFTPSGGLDADMDISTNTITLETTSKRAYLNGISITTGSGGSTIIPVTNITLNPTSKTLTVGESLQLNASVVPSNATYKVIHYSSSDASVASVDTNGLVTALKQGTATITVTDEKNTVSKTCNITVENGSTPSSGIVVDRTFINLKVGGIDKINATISPAQTLTYTSNNKTVVEVDQEGNLKAINSGVAIIKITSADNQYSKEVTVSVTSATGGCSGSIIATSGTIFAISLLGVGLLLLKKKFIKE